MLNTNKWSSQNSSSKAIELVTKRQKEAIERKEEKIRNAQLVKNMKETKALLNKLHKVLKFTITGFFMYKYSNVRVK